jgi:hypothetical protein
VLAAYPDGIYSIEVTGYAWDDGNPGNEVSEEDDINIELHNSSPIVDAGEILDETDATVWEAEWQAVQTDSVLEPEFVILTDETVTPGQTLDASILFSEPMNTSSVKVTAGKAPGYAEPTF